MEENEEFDSDFNPEDIPISEEFWNYMEHYWHNNREFPESTEASLNKKADLVEGKVPSSQLPSYVDDVLEYDTFESLPSSGEKGKIYVITNNNTQFRWSGSEYIQLNSDRDWVNENFFKNTNIFSNNILNVATSLDAELPNGGFISSYNAPNWSGTDGPNGASYGGYIKFSRGTGDNNNLEYYYNNGHNGTDPKLWFRTKEAVNGIKPWMEFFHTGNLPQLHVDYLATLHDVGAATLPYVEGNFVKTTTNQLIDGVKGFTGAYTKWLLNDDTLNATGFAQSSGDAFLTGTLNNKNFVIYRNSIHKIIVDNDKVTFVDNLVIPNAIANNHALNLGHGNSLYIPQTHPINNISQFYLDQWNTYWGYSDTRIIRPDHLPTKKLQFGFTSWNNDNNYPWADYLHFGGYSNSSGGLQNLIMFNKSGFGLRQYFGNPQDVNQYTDSVDYWHTGNFNPSNYWTKSELPDYKNYGLGRTDAVATPDLNNVTSTSIQDIVDTSLNRPFGYGSVWTHRKGGAEFTQMAVNVLDGRLYTRGWSNGMGDTGWNRLALYSEVSGNYALKDGSNATDTWVNSSFGLISNPTIPGKMYNASGASDLINATYGSVTGIVNTAGVTNGNPNDEWFHRIKMLHSNAGGYYTEIGIQMTGGNSMWYKRYQNGTNYDWVKVWDTENFNPDTKVNALENARAIGFSSGNYPTQNGAEYPYMYFDNGSTTGYVALATQDFVNSNFATFSELTNYATLNTYQTITGDKIFTGFVKVPPAYDGDEAVPYNQLLEALDWYTVRNHDGLAKYLGFTGANIANAPYIKTSTDEVITLATEKWSSNNFVSLSSDQNIDGRKRFTTPVRLPEAINNDEAVNLGQTLELVENRTNSKFLTRTTNDSHNYDLVKYGRPQITNIVCKGSGGYNLGINHFETGMTVKVSNTTDNIIYININGGATSAIVEKISWAEFHLDSDGDIIKTDAIQAKII